MASHLSRSHYTVSVSDSRVQACSDGTGRRAADPPTRVTRVGRCRLAAGHFEKEELWPPRRQSLRTRRASGYSERDVAPSIFASFRTARADGPRSNKDDAVQKRGQALDVGVGLGERSLIAFDAQNEIERRQLTYLSLPGDAQKNDKEHEI